MERMAKRRMSVYFEYALWILSYMSLSRRKEGMHVLLQERRESLAQGWPEAS